MHKASSLLLPCMLTQNHVRSQVIYQSHLKTQISLAFNIFYCIISCLSNLIRGMMGNDTPDHQLRTSCPACHHQVEGGPKLPIQFIVTGDGNTSLSHLCHHFEGDSHPFFSDYYVLCQEVDRFSNSHKHSLHATLAHT